MFPRLRVALQPNVHFVHFPANKCGVLQLFLPITTLQYKATLSVFLLSSFDAQCRGLCALQLTSFRFCIDLICSPVDEQTIDCLLVISTLKEVILLSFLKCNTPLSARQHLIERVPADAGPVKHKGLMNIENICYTDWEIQRSRVV